jgi:hypothetical protein
MTIAWGSLVLLVLLLPGFLFFLGIYWPEKFTRENEQRSPLGHLAAVLLVSVVVQALGFAVVSAGCRWSIPCINVGLLLDTLNPTESARDRVDVMFHQYVWWILAYQLATGFAGLALGALYSQLTASGFLRRLVRHRWIYELNTEGFTYAHVMTHVRQDSRILMYKGFLVTFGLQHDGRFSYIVLRDVVRLYMDLQPEGATTSAEKEQKKIGSAAGGGVEDPAAGAQLRRLHSYFVIDGEDIANAVFDRLEAKVSAPRNFDELVETVRREMEQTRKRLQDRGVNVTRVDTGPEPRTTSRKKRR